MPWIIDADPCVLHLGNFYPHCEKIEFFYKKILDSS